MGFFRRMTDNSPAGSSRSGLRRMLWFLCILALADCSGPSCRVQGTGTMRYLEMEGGFYGIDADSGAHYRPVNLPKGFAEDGLRVRFCAQPLEATMSFQMWGIPVTIVRMESLETNIKENRTTGQTNPSKPRNP